MSEKATQFQKRVMSLGYRGKEIFKPLGTGWIDERVACVREWIANIFFYTKDGVTLMLDAGYSYPRLAEKMAWLDIDPASIRHILVTHLDTDHVGALEPDAGGIFSQATVYLGREESRYLTGEVPRKVVFGTYRLPRVTINNTKELLEDGQVLDIGGIRVECIQVPGHTWGHMVYLVDDAYLFTGDTIWLGADGGRSFINSLAEDNKLAMRSLAKLQGLLQGRGISPKVITGHTGWSDDMDYVFRHIDRVCNSAFRQSPHDPTAPLDGYVEDDDTEESARAGLLPKAYDAAAQGEPDSERKAQIKRAYGMGKTNGFYDGMMRGTTRSGRWMLRHVWRMTREDALEYQARAFEPIPADFSGTLLEVPVGTGVISLPVYKTLPSADITCLDYSEKMMATAQERAEELAVGNVTFVQGDVGALPFEDESFDAVVSLNGFHAFPNKEAAYAETYRVLRPGGTFCGCFYVKGSCAHTDKVISALYVRAGYFTPPFETVESLRVRLEGMYSQVEVTNVQSIAVFSCVK